MNQESIKKIIGAVLILSIIIPSSFLLKPQKAEAMSALSVPIYESGSAVTEPKEGWYGSGFGWDTVGWGLAKMAIASMTNSIVNWINTGFEGSPAFVSDPESYFLDLADQASGAFIRDLGAEGLLCDRFKPYIIFSLQYTVPTMEKFRCTVSSAIDNWEGFINDFNEGGWKGWLAVSTQPQNNPYGAYLNATEEHERKRAEAQERGKTEIGWNSGFLSLKECSADVNYDTAIGSVCADECVDLDTEEEVLNCVNICKEMNEDAESSYSKKELCELNGGQMQNTTPGKVIADQLEISLGSSFRQMELADEISESLGAIFNALLSQLMQSGLRSLTDSGEDNWYSSYDIGKEQSIILKKINASIKDEEDYKKIKDDSVGVLSDKIIILQNTIICYEDKGVSASDSTIQFSLAEIDDAESVINDFNNDIAVAEDNLESLDAVKSKVMSATTADDLNEALNEYNALMLDLHGQADIVLAESALDGPGGIREEYNDAVEEYNLCALAGGSVVNMLSISPALLDFGELEAGVFGFLSKDFTIGNDSDSVSIQITNTTDPSSPFSIEYDGCSGETLAFSGSSSSLSSEECLIGVEFRPLKAKVYYESFVINSSAGSRHAFLKGTGK